MNRNIKNLVYNFLFVPDFSISHTIYTLTNPATKEIFYVGVTQRPLSIRLKYHIISSKLEAGSYIKHSYIRQMVDGGIEPLIEPLETIVSTNERELLMVREMEKYWTRQFRQWGFNLVNTNNKI